ncbi:MAG: translation elongation factor 4, partial [Synergistaceae bacterium]|nr:translation elongation factor 4 [Synergistaceae bacterium]
VRVVDGVLRSGRDILFMATGGRFTAEEVGVFRPAMTPTDSLGPGEVGYVAAGIKTLAEARVGDTVTDAASPAPAPLPGYRKAKSVVFCGFYPVERDDYPQLRDALEKLTLNDSAIAWEPETSAALGFGFRCGFLGLLHMDVARERLRREFGVELVATAPNVVYEIESHGSVIEARRPTDFPDAGEIDEVREPFIKLSVFLPSDYVGRVMKLVQERRGTYRSMDYLTPERVRLIYDMPLSEFIVDFHDKLKSITRGYASLDYEFIGLRPADLVRVDVLVNGEAADAFSFICHKDAAYHRGQAAVTKLKALIPNQLFEVPIQASIGRRVIVRANVRALRKDVLAKCYGGDITRKRKLLEKQKEGKKRMKQIGKVSIPQEAFLAFLRVEEEKDDSRS